MGKFYKALQSSALSSPATVSTKVEADFKTSIAVGEIIVLHGIHTKFNYIRW
jgi:hypothetical protein